MRMAQALTAIKHNTTDGRIVQGVIEASGGRQKDGMDSFIITH